MSSALAMERVRGDIEILSRAGLDTATFVEEFEGSLTRAVPHIGACIATVDPATFLLTGTYKFGDLAGKDERDHEWGLIEYGEDDPTSFAAVAAGQHRAVTVSGVTDGDLMRSVRLREFIEPHFGYGDELRMVGRQHRRGWGGVALFRGGDDAVFTATELDFVASLSTAFAAGLRSGLLVRTAGGAESGPGRGPAVVIVNADGELDQLSVGAQAVLDEIFDQTNMAPASGIIGGLVAGARRYAAGVIDSLPRTRVRMPTGRWLVLHASPLSGAAGGSGDVAITIEEARPPEIVPLVVAAFELTPRERDVTQLVLQGVETREIAQTLHMSRYTVQDHLKAVFDKADVRSRRELVSRIYFEQYAPRMGQELGTDGWFLT